MPACPAPTRKEDWDRQIARLVASTSEQDGAVTRAVSEIGSGRNGHRPKLFRLLTDPKVGTIVVEHRDRLMGFGFEDVEAAPAAQGRRIGVVGPGEVKEDLVQDRIEVLTSFCARLYGRRSARNKAKKALEAIEHEGEPCLSGRTGPQRPAAHPAGQARGRCSVRLQRGLGSAHRAVPADREDAIEQHRELNRLKKTESPWRYEVSECAPQAALRDLDRAFANFFRGLKEGRKVGFPRFRKKGRDDRFRRTGAVRGVGRAVSLPRRGRIRRKEERQVEGRILSATVNREAERWYVSLTVEVDLPDPEPVRGPVGGVDVGLPCFATVVGDDGTVAKIEAPRPLERSLRRRQRQHSRKQRGSKNRRRSALRLARWHRRLRNIRRDFLHQLPTHLAKTKSGIVVEGLNVNGRLPDPYLARHIADSG
jgi:hypothetical protein